MALVPQQVVVAELRFTRPVHVLAAPVEGLLLQLVFMHGRQACSNGICCRRLAVRCRVLVLGCLVTSRIAPCLSLVGTALMLLTATALSPFALAEPLPKEQCEALAAERALLEGGGASENITRGPEWGKVNMTAEQLNYVRRLIAVREDLLFRCRDHDVIGKPTLPSSAPADAPEPGRKPAVKSGARKAKDVPPPSRPSRVEAKAAEPGAESRPTRKSVPGTSGKAASRPAAKRATMR